MKKCNECKLVYNGFPIRGGFDTLLPFSLLVVVGAESDPAMVVM